MSTSMDLPSGVAVAHRLQVRHWSAVCRGGVHLVCVYLHAGEGLSRRNLDILQELAFVLNHLRGPWVCGGDFNLTVDELEHANWFQMSGGAPAAPMEPTCGERCIDFFVVSQPLRKHVIAVQRLERSGITPHCPVRLLLDGACRNETTRALRTPARIGAFLPTGCLSEAATCAQHVCEDDASSQLCGTYHAAEQIAAEVLALSGNEVRAIAGRANGPSYVWRPYCAPKAEASAKVSALALAWRTGATALRRLQARYSGGAWRHGVEQVCQLLCRTTDRVLGDERRSEWSIWCRMVQVTLQHDCSRARIGQLGAIAAAQARAVAKADAATAARAFKSWLHDGPVAGLGRQHRFTRTASGWAPSTLIQVPPDGDDDEVSVARDRDDGEALLEGASMPVGLPHEDRRPASLQEEDGGS